MDARLSSPQEIPWGWRETVHAVVFVGGMAALVLYGARMREESASFSWFVAMLASLLAISSLTSFAVMRSFGARPKPGWKWGVGPALASWWTAEGHKLTARQFAAVGTAPVLATLAAGTVYILVTPVGVAGAHLLLVYALVTLKSLWLSLIALRQPEGTLFEERAAGSFLYRPLGRGT